MRPMPTPEMSDTTTQGIRVGATAYYLPEESERQGIEVVRLPEGQLLPFIREARQSFKQYSKARSLPLN